MRVLVAILAVLFAVAVLAQQVPQPQSDSQKSLSAQTAARTPKTFTPTLVTWVPYAASLFALGISLCSFYFQWIHARGARVTLLNDNDTQNSAVRTWSALPRNVQNDFPEFDQTYPGYALVRLVVLNTGDRPGYLKIASAVADVPWPTAGDPETPRVSYYTYVVVPALAVTDKLIIVRNLPDVETGANIIVRLRLETGGPAGRFRVRLRKEHHDCVLTVRLVPSKMAGIFNHARIEVS